MRKTPVNRTSALYAAPVCEVFEVRFEGVVCSSPDGYHEGGGGSYDNDDTNDNGDY